MSIRQRGGGRPQGLSERDKVDHRLHSLKVVRGESLGLHAEALPRSFADAIGSAIAAELSSRNPKEPRLRWRADIDKSVAGRERLSERLCSKVSRGLCAPGSTKEVAAARLVPAALRRGARVPDSVGAVSTAVDIAVVGRGLLGSAAARHLTELSAASTTVAIIGPREPTNRAAHDGVFGAHYDSGRITRVIDRDPFYARLNAASIARHRALEARTGVTFYERVGHLAVSPIADYLAALEQRAVEHEISAERIPGDELGSRFSALSFAGGCDAVFDPSGGWIDPRRFIEAQNQALVLAGGFVIDDAVTDLVATDNSVTLRTSDGSTVITHRVLLATGAFANHLGVIPKEIDFEVHEHTVVLGEVNEADATDLASMPSVIYKRGDAVGESVYVLPPIRYPDGRTYIKIGQSTGKAIADPATELIPWFQGDGDPAISAWLTNELTALLPQVTFQTMHPQSCVTTKSPTGRQFIDRFGGGQVFALLAGNGQVAKSADELGWIAARRLLDGVVPQPYHAEDFRLRHR